MCFKFFKVLFIKICEIQSADLLSLVLFISFYISRYLHPIYSSSSSSNIRYLHPISDIFIQISSSSFSRYLHPTFLKKDFVTNFSFLKESLNFPHFLNSQSPLSVTKVLYQCSLNVTYHVFSRLLCYDDASTRAELILQYFNPTLIPGLLSSYKPLDWGLPKTFIYGRKTSIGATRYSIDTCNG